MDLLFKKSDDLMGRPLDRSKPAKEQLWVDSELLDRTICLETVALRNNIKRYVIEDLKET